MAKITRNGHGQIELNQVAFRRDGRVEAQLPFVGAEGNTCENGMILAVDKVGGKVEYAGTTVEGKVYGIVYTSEEMYNDAGLKDFYLEIVNGKCVGPKGYDVLPRLGFLSVGDRFTTNAFDDTDVDVTAGVFAGVGASGYVVLATEAPAAGPVLQVVEKTTMPDGQDAAKFIVIKD